MEKLIEEDAERVCGGMTLEPYDPNEICAYSGGSDAPVQPQRSDYPAGSGGDFAYRYDFAVYRNYMVENGTEGCITVGM